MTKPGIFVPLLLCLPIACTANDLAFQQYQCDENYRFEIRLPKPDQLELRIGDAIKTLPQVIAASGIRYSDGETVVWLKGDVGMLEQNEQIVANNCRVTPTEEPLTPIRDAASGLVFIPPARWTAQKVQLAVKSGSEVPVDDFSDAVQFEYRFRDTNSQQFPLLNILVLPKAEWDKQAEANSTPNGLWLGEDTRHVYLAQLPEAPSDLTSEAGQMFLDLQISEAEVKEAFSMYGVVANNRVETVTAKVMWLDRALYPGATLTVELRNVSRMDAPAEIIAKQQLTL